MEVFVLTGCTPLPSFTDKYGEQAYDSYIVGVYATPAAAEMAKAAEETADMTMVQTCGCDTTQFSITRMPVIGGSK